MVPVKMFGTSVKQQNWGTVACDHSRDARGNNKKMVNISAGKWKIYLEHPPREWTGISYKLLRLLCQALQWLLHFEERALGSCKASGGELLWYSLHIVFFVKSALDCSTSLPAGPNAAHSILLRSEGSWVWGYSMWWPWPLLLQASQGKSWRGQRHSGVAPHAIRLACLPQLCIPLGS